MEVIDLGPVPIHGRKRKADAQDAHNERLSKRLSLLNLEKNGAKMYVPVENPTVRPPTPPPRSATSEGRGPAIRSRSHSSEGAARPPALDAMMQLDDSKYKVYIYNLDDELASDSEPEEAKLVFLPDIEKHLRNSRVRMPPTIPPKPEGQELAGKQLVLYSVPSSLSVPQDQDSVRKAIIEARSRARARSCAQFIPAAATESPVGGPAAAALPAPASFDINRIPGATSLPHPVGTPAMSLSLSGDDDPDAMEID